MLRLVILLLALVGAAPALAQQTVSVVSPDGQIRVTVGTTGEGRAYYNVSRDGQPVVSDSRLGFLFTDAMAFDRGVAIAAHNTASADTRWELPWGERRFVRDHHNELSVTLRPTGTGTSKSINAPLSTRYQQPTRQ